MKDNNVRALSKLSGFCKYSGLMSTFLGIVIVFIDLINKDWIHMQIGLFVFICGYSFVKIGVKISSVLFDERTELR